MTLIEWHNKYQAQLQGRYEVDAIRFYFKQLIDVFFGLGTTTLGLHPNWELNLPEERLLETALSRLLDNEPLQYILGHTSFMGMDLKVNSHTLIPRPETEELVAWVLESTDSKGRVVLDVGTGSGCIALALKKARSNWIIHALDVSPEALDLAKQNAKNLRLELDWFQADIKALPKTLPNFDIIISNPPYVTAEEKKYMRENVLDYEPHLALFTPEGEPLFYYKKIMEMAQKKLRPTGRVYLEINPMFYYELREMVVSFGFKKIELRKDIFHKKRMLCCQR